MWRGQTVGKLLCGLQVRRVADRSARLSLSSVLVRESIGKSLSAVFLLIGYLWVALSKNKRAWHDFFAGTWVARLGNAGGRVTVAVALGIAVGLTVTGNLLYQGFAAHIHSRQVAVPDQVGTADTARAAAALTSISSLANGDLAPYVEWLDQHGKEPAAYAVEVAAQHQVTIFGEGRHGDADYLAFFNRIIPDLYHHAQVTYIALETCPASNNDRLARLLTAPSFDADLIREIARTEIWQRDGYEHLWKVLETVWKVNLTIPAGHEKMRVIGMDIDADLPSFALLGLGDDGLEAVPPWEKLRALRLLDDMPRILYRDELMAHTVIQEAIEKDKRVVILVGANHSYLNYAQPRVIRDGKVIREWRRMGYMLHHRYGERVFQINMHRVPILEWLERVMARRQDAPVGFTVEGSPFATLEAGFSYQPTVSLGDLASGYIFLKPARDYVRSERIAGFISEEMFWRNKPFYEASAGRSLRDAREANEVIP